MQANTSLSLKIANGQSLSNIIDFGLARPFAIQMPAAWTAANLTFQASIDGVTFADLYDDAGVEVLLTATASHVIIMPPSKFIGLRWLKVRSGTAGVAVAQGAERVLLMAGVQ